MTSHENPDKYPGTGDSNSKDNDRTVTAGEGAKSGRLEPHHPRQIGQYQLTRVIASGGMGTVYEGLQENPRCIKRVGAGCGRGGLAGFAFEFPRVSPQRNRRCAPPRSRVEQCGGGVEKGGLSIQVLSGEMRCV